MRLCCIPGCGQKLRTRRFMFPKICKKNKSSKELSQQRQYAWMSALGKTFSDQNALPNLEVCNSHFISGKMASLQDVDNIDWIPSINLGKEQSERTLPILRCSVFDCTASNQEGQGCRFYRIPKINENGVVRQFSDETMSAWISVLGIRDDCPATHGSVYVCQAHYNVEMKLETSHIKAITSDSDEPESCDESFTNDVESTDINIFPKSYLSNGQTVNRLPLVPRHPFASIASSKNDPPFFKSGEILRNDNGNFVFLCGHCGDFNVDWVDMMDHINEHFDEKIDSKMPTSPLPSPEFVSCTAIKDFKMEPGCGETFQELTNKTSTSPDAVLSLPVTLVMSETHRPTKRSSKVKRIDTTADVRTGTPELELSIFPIDIQSEPTSPVSKTEQESSHSEWSCSSDEDYEIEKKKSKKRGKKSKSKVVAKRRRPELLPNNCYQCALEPAMASESDLRRHKCVICKEWFTNHIDFRAHLNTAHGRENVDDFNALAREYNEFTCYICEHNVKTQDYLTYHVKGHFDIYLKYQCDECGKRIRSKGTLRQHMKKHEDEPTECDLCNKVFSNHFRMRRHRVCHKTELAHVCEVCSKGFKLRKYLNRHMAKHKDTKVHCRYCDKSFSFATSRRAHEKSQHNVT